MVCGVCICYALCECLCTVKSDDSCYRIFTSLSAVETMFRPAECPTDVLLGELQVPFGTDACLKHLC